RSLETEGLRPLGRLALVDNAPLLLAGLRQALARITSPEALSSTVGLVGRSLRSENPRVFLVASINGGTGSGMLVDVAYAIQQVLAERHLPTDELCGVLLHAVAGTQAARTRGLVNACATLRELDHWGRLDVGFP